MARYALGGCFFLAQFGTLIACAGSRFSSQINNWNVYNGLERQLSSKTWPVQEPLQHEGFGAGEGNRTLVCSLGSCRSTIELRPHQQRQYPRPRAPPRRAFLSLPRL